MLYLWNIETLRKEMMRNFLVSNPYFQISLIEKTILSHKIHYIERIKRISRSEIEYQAKTLLKESANG